VPLRLGAHRLQCHRVRSEDEPAQADEQERRTGGSDNGGDVMARTAAEVLIDQLIDWGVDTVFGLPGDGINGIMEALRTRQEKIRFLQVRHEEAAAFMACGYAKFTGKLGVCLATSGPGAIHLLNGLYDAKMDGAPVLAITGQTYHDLMGTQYQQEVDLLSLFKDVAVYNQMMLGAAQMRALVDAACRAALAEQSVAHITVPVDLQEQKLSEDEPSAKKVPGHTSSVWTPPVRVPIEEQLVAAAELLNHGKKTVILAGRGALGACEELEALADRLAAPIVKALLGKAAVPDDSPFTTGGLGLLGTRPSEMAMEECDTLLMVGTNFPVRREPCRSIGIRPASACATRSRWGSRATPRPRSARSSRGHGGERTAPSWSSPSTACASGGS
jgi:pyruvate dehydrogenase (quinone)